jgi:hypothetical protein
LDFHPAHSGSFGHVSDALGQRADPHVILRSDQFLDLRTVWHGGWLRVTNAYEFDTGRCSITQPSHQSSPANDEVQHG